MSKKKKTGLVEYEYDLSRPMEVTVKSPQIEIFEGKHRKGVEVQSVFETEKECRAYQQGWREGYLEAEKEFIK